MRRDHSVVYILSTVLILCLSLLIANPCQSARKRPGAQAPAASRASDPNGGAADRAVAKASIVVARIGDYTLTRAELEERLRQAMQPPGDDERVEREPVTTEVTLRDMVAEKALVMEGRKLGYHEDETIQNSIKEFRQRELVKTLLENYLRENPPPKVGESEVDRLAKANPKLTREQVLLRAQRVAAGRVLEQFYNRLLENSGLKKNPENLAKAVKIHERLLKRPVKPRRPNEYWIKNSQVREELSKQEKALVLATFKGGQFTLGEWFVALCNIVPPRRPQNLNTIAGVEILLDKALQTPILVAEAEARGHAKNKELQELVRQREDQRVLWKAMAEKTKEVEEPNDAEIKAYFEQHKEHFARGPVLKVDQIWFRDKRTAEKAREALDEGTAFAGVKSEYSLQKERGPHDVRPSGEGRFWQALWQADPNEIVGPLRGFYSDGLRWRIVKVLEKTPAEEPEYTDQIANRVKWAIYGQRRAQALDDYKKKLLRKYSHEILTDRIRDIDPLKVATKEGDG